MAGQLMHAGQARRNAGLDLIKVIAAFGVVVLHFVGPQAGSGNAVIYLIAAFSIPVFVMVNGYFVLNKRGETRGYGCRKAADLLLLCLLWSVVIWCLFSMANQNMGPWGPMGGLYVFFSCSLQRGDASILWFLWMLAGLELVSPLIKRAARKIGLGSIAALFGVVCLCINIGSCVLEARCGHSIQDVVPQSLRIWTWLFYFCLGGYLGRSDVKKRTLSQGAVPAGITFLIGSGGLIIWGYGVRWALWGMDKAEYLYDDPAVALMAVGLFVFCDVGCTRLVESSHGARCIAKMSSACLGVYVLQVPVRAVFRHYYLLDNPILNILLVPFVWALLLLMTLVLMRLPGFRWLVKVGLFSRLSTRETTVS